MTDKKTEGPGLTTGEAKGLELDEQSNPTRKTSDHSPPMSYNEETSEKKRHKKNEIARNKFSP